MPQLKVINKKEDYTVLPGQDDLGNHIFSVLVKRTYSIKNGKQAKRETKTFPLVQIDEYYENGDPEYASVKYENDLYPFKKKTDVIFIGKVYAPNHTPVQELDILINVEEFKKKVKVFGDRYCIHRKKCSPLFTEPEEFISMDVQYEGAFGGRDELSDPEVPFFYPRNTIGKGVAVKNIKEVIDGLPLPNFEDPGYLLEPEGLILEKPENWSDMPLPQGFGYFQRTWYPRSSFAGTIPGYVTTDQKFQEEEYGYIPQNQIALARQFKLPAYDFSFHNGASLGMTFPYLKGGEKIFLHNLCNEGDFIFALPNDIPKIILDIGLGENLLQSKLYTVCIRMEDRQVDLVWCGSQIYPGIEWLAHMSNLKVEIQ